jgi:hypothetical protein
MDQQAVAVLGMGATRYRHHTVLRKVSPC